MKYCILYLTILLIPNLQTIDINKLKKDPIMIEYKKVFNDLMDASMTRKYQMPPNAMKLQKKLAKNPSKENMKKLYKDAGMKNSDEYVDKIFLQTTLMFQFLKKHPEIAKLDQKAKMELLQKLLID